MTTKGSGKGKDGAKNLTISRKMSAPKVNHTDGTKVSGAGLALVGVPIEQDAAYWEWHIQQTGGAGSGPDAPRIEDDESNAPKFGVATKKDGNFYKALASHAADGDATPEEDGTALMRSILVEDGDTVGVAVQQSDLPMVQFLLNGEPLHDLAINRFRGAVYPSIYIREGFVATGVFDEDNWQELSPHARFGPLIAARGII
eukprot:CAMPEP_0183291780 /NCGR_PEP_ID=MMETSP0160_2-20130417/1074_1 /TAXON_ID=2839 ORGANISM="Odontella Sinensis, Strain Grunow 1884" /NCGR_SAMPLE_ID=MMETSP0160_2 /ASSEMBLY_ACC=CAM_ASM_000250 /LENGTH=200 /DNA_ID=CAMNT_0025452625 /DNA_START=138 /DNA_END=740 /DNA_ORIENTATION=+